MDSGKFNDTDCLTRAQVCTTGPKLNLYYLIVAVAHNIMINHDNNNILIVIVL